MAFIGGGIDHVAGTSGVIKGFDLLRDRLDFGDVSVHGMILGKLVDGSAVIVNPWQPDSYQRITDLNGDPVRWNQLTMENFAPVGNEHLRTDAGAVMSWELGVGRRSDAVVADAEGRIDFTHPGAAVVETVYIRSHEYGVQEVVSNFDPENDKISFIYLGTRERISALDTDQGLLISVEPSGQSVLIEGVQSTRLRADNVEFHFDQVREDNLEAVLGFDQNDVALVDRTILLTPAAPAGASTDGFQVESGNPVYSTGAQLASGEPGDHSGHGDQEHGDGEDASHDTADDTVGHGHGYAAGSLHLQASGTLYWGGMSGTLTITNPSDRAIENWSVSFETPHRNFQSWAGDAVVEVLEGGGNRVTLTPAAWNSSIGAGQSIDVSFNAESVGLANSGELTTAQFFLGDGGVDSDVVSETPTSDPEPEVGVEDSTPPIEPDEPPAPPLVEVPDPAEGPVDGPAEVIADSDKKVVAYFEEWGIYQRDFLVSDINVGELTHINYSFFDVTANGDVQLFDSWAATDKRFGVSDQVSRTFSAAEWEGLSSGRRNAYLQGGQFTASTNDDGSVTVTGVPMGWNMPVDYVGNLRQLDLLKQLNPEINLGLALGGWTLSDEFSLAVDSAADREAFTSSIVETLERFDFFNIVDFDWEYPGGGGEAGNAASPDDGTNFALTLELLRSKLDGLELSTGRQYEISVATAGGYDKLANLNLAGIDPYVDFYNVMTYDFHGGWESVTGHQAAMVNDPGGYDVVTAIQQFQDNGVDLSKVVLGAPAYTRAWGNVDAGETLGLGNSGDSRQAPGSFEAGNYDQKDLITGVADGSFTLVWDDDAKAAFVYNEDTRVWSSIETAATIAGKAAYVDALGLGGMMFWALSNDSSGDQSLISAASDLLRGGATTDEVMARSVQFDAVLGGDGQFGLDDCTLLA